MLNKCESSRSWRFGSHVGTQFCRTGLKAELARLDARLLGTSWECNDNIKLTLEIRIGLWGMLFHDPQKALLFKRIEKLLSLTSTNEREADYHIRINQISSKRIRIDKFELSDVQTTF